jgi:hypothetical protein
MKLQYMLFVKKKDTRKIFILLVFTKQKRKKNDLTKGSQQEGVLFV